MREGLKSKNTNFIPKTSFFVVGKFVVFVSLCFSLIIFDRLQPERSYFLRKVTVDFFAPTLSILSAPFTKIYHFTYEWGSLQDTKNRLYNLTQENQILRKQILILQSLKAENEDLTKLLNFQNQFSFDFVTGRVIADHYSPYVRSLIIHTYDDHIKIGQAVIAGNGLIGYVVERGDNYCRVLLINDFNARVAVRIGEDHYHAILAGNNSKRPELLYVPQDIILFPGMEVFTSGVGSLIPQGIPIGHIAAITDGNIYIQPKARLDKIDYVSIIINDTPKNE